MADRPAHRRTAAARGNRRDQRRKRCRQNIAGGRRANRGTAGIAAQAAAGRLARSYSHGCRPLHVRSARRYTLRASHPRGHRQRRPDEAGPQACHQPGGHRQPDRPDGRGRRADHRVDVGYRRRHHRPAGRVPAALFRRGDIRCRPCRHPDPSRARRADDGDHDLRPLRKCDHRRNWLHEDAGGSRRPYRDRPQPRWRAGVSAPRRPRDRHTVPYHRSQFRRAGWRDGHGLALFGHPAGCLHRPTA
ncbi:hypothetical protein NTH_00009 [Nitratireductor thuwali]|uniref:Uncharacterized protein n=1 Tax=Nitratireductor thuwali TaxID=2267699 RepID=A0ABY5MDP0_9HYPH|nr:hypothetical protein NTH_00009 [Nitratireductor thuwali]